jgi:DNA-binding NarL/FixJ family response regulator
MSGPKVPPRRVRVVVVDDSVHCRRAASDVVRLSVGFELSGVAGSGAEAIVLTGKVEPDLVLLDIRMREMSGFEAARRILELRPQTVVVLVSAWADESIAGAVERCGAAAMLHKRDLKPAVLGELWSLHGPALVP